MMYLVDLYNTIAEPEPPQTWPQKEFGNYFIFLPMPPSLARQMQRSSFTTQVTVYEAYQNQQKHPQMSDSMGASLSSDYIVAPVVRTGQINAATLLASPRMSRTISYVAFDVKQWHDNCGVKNTHLPNKSRAEMGVTSPAASSAPPTAVPNRLAVIYPSLRRDLRWSYCMSWRYRGSYYNALGIISDGSPHRRER
ncbi:hypothetical protein BGY98DRAFT_965655 [Russula aff. rugulosa BPL654]|nr:hypothetical protein BGY98DRAFT_965655 [Russula aff. rugulosa BPL654]